MSRELQVDRWMAWSRIRGWLVVLVLVVTPSVGANPLIEPFYGRYIGQGEVEDAQGRSRMRDLSVLIQPAAQPGQFFVQWTTVTHKPDGRLKRKVYKIKFTPTARPNIYASAMKTNVFGGQVPLDPLRGDPFVWARVKNNTLTVHALIITQDGGYEMQVYDRTLNDQGLLLNFHRYRAGKELREVEAQLVRVAD